MDERQESARPQSAAGQDKRVIVVVVLALLGAWISLNLTSFHLSGGQGGAGVFRSVCEMTGGGCGQVLHSQWAMLPRRIPLALGGVIYFSVIALWYLVVGRPNRAGRGWYLPIFALQLLSALFSLFLLGVMLVQLRTLCGWCLLAHLVNFALLGLAWKLWPRGPRLAGESPWPPARIGVATLLLIFGVAVFWNQWLINRFLSAEAEQIRSDTDLMRYLHLRNPRHEIPIGADEPARGNAAAPHTVVVFSDFQCPSCGKFAAFFDHQIFPKYGDRLRIVYKHLPLEAECNPKLQTTRHPQACEAAYAAEAARELGGTEGFWKMHDALFTKQEDVAAGRWAELAAGVGLDGAAVAQRVAERRHEDRVAESVRLGETLKLPGTPAIFIDGRYLEDWTRLELWDAIFAAPADHPPASPQAEPHSH